MRVRYGVVPTSAPPAVDTGLRVALLDDTPISAAHVGLLLVMAAAVVALAAPVNTAVLAGNEQVILIERGLTGEANAQ